MPGAAVGSVLEVTVQQTCNNQTIESVLHYVVQTQSGQATPLADQNAFFNLITEGGTFDILTPWAGTMGTNGTIAQIRTQYIFPTRIRATVASVLFAGTRSGTCTAQNVAGVITKQTDLAGRSQVGAVHLGCLSASDYTAGNTTVSWQTAAVTLENALKTQVAENLGPGLWNPCLFHKGKVGAAAYSLVTNMFVQQTLRTMRRRTVGLGI